MTWSMVIPSISGMWELSREQAIGRAQDASLMDFNMNDSIRVSRSLPNLERAKGICLSGVKLRREIFSIALNEMPLTCSVPFSTPATSSSVRQPWSRAAWYQVLVKRVSLVRWPKSTNSNR